MFVTFGRRPRRRMPRQIRPSQIEREYARRLLALVGRVRIAFAQVIAEAPALLEAAARERADADLVAHFPPDGPTPVSSGTRADLARARSRADAGEGRRMAELVEGARRRLEEAIRPRELEDLAEQIARATANHQAGQLGRQVRAALGVDVLFPDRKLAATMEGFVHENVALCKALPLDVATRLEQTVTRGVASGTPWRKVAKEMDESFALGRKRAHVIARDQIGKFYGQVNETRQREIGVKKYTWRTAGDTHVRGTPGGPYAKARYSHHARNEQVFEWDKPPPDGHPGTPILCRCFPDPVLTDLLGE